MRRKNHITWLVILIVVSTSFIVLFPTYELNRQKKEAEKFYSKIEANTTLTRGDIKAALASGNLELNIRDNFTGTSDTGIEDLIKDVDALIKLDEKIADNEPKSIKLGLDLQGGTYLVYEVDLPKLLETLAKERDNEFDVVIGETVKRIQHSNEDFLDVLPQVFAEHNLNMNRYFGRARDSNDEIISHLKKEAEDAVDRTLEVLRNRIDQFGVSEPSITKQGAQRIVVELAGIDNVERAKSIIGTTALLEFQLEKEPEVIRAVRNQINRVMMRQMGKESDDSETTESDSLPDQQKLRKDTQVAVDELFGATGASLVEEGADTDTTDVVDVDQDVFEERPFDALLGREFGGSDILVPTKNVRTVERILNSPEVQKVIPKDAEFLFGDKPIQVGEQELYPLYMLKKEPDIIGAMIEDAQTQIGSQLEAGKAEVGLDLNGEGARIFAKVTGANVNKRMAIVLDEKVKSIPTIIGRIPNGRARITGMANIEEANDLSIVLRAGALPAPIEAIEERTVGPSLGHDSIRKGTLSAFAGFICVVIFIIVYYRWPGIVANTALMLNILIILAALAFFGATLTLPGIAGIILTIGMAIDANVLIFERIREERKKIKEDMLDAISWNTIDKGYKGAMSPILDANITTLITALVLFQFGTGPIRGFALTLSIGIIVSLFTAIIVTRVIFDFFVKGRDIKLKF